jgi:hypothetical protein
MALTLPTVLIPQWRRATLIVATLAPAGSPGNPIALNASQRACQPSCAKRGWRWESLEVPPELRPGYVARVNNYGSLILAPDEPQA